MSDQPTKKFRIRCPSCGALMHSPVDPGGKTVKCPKCSQPFAAVAEPPAEPTPTQPPEPTPSPSPEPDNPFAGIAEKINAPAAVAENPFAGIAEKRKGASSTPPPPPPKITGEEAPSPVNPFAAPATAERPTSRAAVDGATWTLEKIHPLQAGKVFAALSLIYVAFFALLYTPLILLAVAFAPDSEAAAVGGLGVVIGFLFAAGFAVVGGFFSGSVGALIYNRLIVKMVGGLRFDYR